MKNVVEFEPVHSDTIAPEAYLKLDYEAIIDLIKKLPKGAREVFNLYVIDGYDHNEIAEIAGYLCHYLPVSIDQGQKMAS